LEGRIMETQKEIENNKVEIKRLDDNISNA